MLPSEILKETGEFGLAQWYLLSVFAAVNVFSAFHYFAQTFISLIPRKECNISSGNETLYETIEDQDIYKINESDWNGWKFETLTSELNWTCQDAWKSSAIQSMFFLGSVVGTFLLGMLSDLFGRIPMLVTAHLFAVFGNLLTVSAKSNVWFLGAARFVAGSATDTNFFTMYIIVMEYVSPRTRTSSLNLCIGVWYCVGCLVTPWLAVASGNWKVFLMAASLPSLAVPISCFFVPESAQWLLSVGRTDDAIRAYDKIASLNGRSVSENFKQRFKTWAGNIETNKEKANLLGLFRTPRLRRKTCILIMKTIILTLCYDAISRNIEGLGLDPFTVFTITSASIFPSCVVILLLQDKVGRKPMAVLSLLLTGLFNFGQGACLASGLSLAHVGATVGLLGRFFVNIAYNSGTQYAAELIPTQVRGQGLAVLHVIGYGAAFFSPYILYASKMWVASPELILGIMSVAGAAFCLFLPETLNKPLPCTLQDGEVFGEEEKIWTGFQIKKSLH